MLNLRSTRATARGALVPGFVRVVLLHAAVLTLSAKVPRPCVLTLEHTYASRQWLAVDMTVRTSAWCSFSAERLILRVYQRRGLAAWAGPES